MEGELVFLGFMMLIGQIVLLQMWNANWFKKENWKLSRSYAVADNKIRMRKLEKDLGLTHGKEAKEPRSTFDAVKDLLPIIKNLNPDQLEALIDRFVGGGEVESSGDGQGLDLLLGFAEENPDVVKGFLDGLKGDKNESQTEEITPQM